METFEAKDLDQLSELIRRFGNDALFRGQTRFYGDNDKPSVVTSFDRLGCIPSEMLKWSTYASNVLEVFIGEQDDNRDFQQALLQHYGWRSFYIDCTSNPAIAAWFASHNYSDKLAIEMSEDCEERPVWLRKRMAHYEFEDGEGYLYILDKQMAERVGLTDLADLAIEGFRPRTAAQSAWMLGPLRNKPVPEACFRAQISAKRGLLRDYAASFGLTNTDAVFPPVAEDPILKALLGLPWREIEAARDKDFPIPFFKRALDLPEYQESFVKIAWPNTAFYRGAKIGDNFASIDGDSVGGITLPVPNIVLFGSADKRTPMQFPKVEALVKEKGTVAFEIDELIQHANMGNMTLYQKGVAVMPHGPDLYEICELAVEHPGLDLRRAGLNLGWFYRVGADGLWVRERHERECGCGSEAVHGRHISALHIAEAYLREPESFAD